MVYYKLHTTFISSNVSWWRHDVAEKLLIFGIKQQLFTHINYQKGG